MSKRYTKFNSNYLMRNEHQQSDSGRIMERDWVTTNGMNVLRFGSGRRIWYNSGNFVFTTSNIPTYHKKHKLSTEIKEFVWDDVANADGTVNEVKPSFNTNDLRDYAYYGSCVELIRSTIEDIISDFPGCITSTKEQPLCNTDKGVIESFKLDNQFNIDLHHNTVKLDKYDNKMRYMSQSWSMYCIEDSSLGEDEIHQMVVIAPFGEYTVGETIPTEDYNKLSFDEKENFRQINAIKSYRIDDGENDVECPSNNEGKVMKSITITTYGGMEYIIKAYLALGDIVYTYDGENEIRILPSNKYINEYFASLTCFKKQLLRQDTKPYYSNKFITPIEYNFKMYYPERLYVWPSNGYCIDISSMAFSSFIEKMYDIGQKFDDLWCDNIYRSMTHEAIKNFDWTYSRDFYDGDAQDNIEGGERMQKILRVMGRALDDVKFYMDTIKHTNNITYDGVKNIPDAMLSDKVNLMGIDVVSTIGIDYDIDTSISDEFLSRLDKCQIDDGKKYSELPRWYSNKYSTDIYSDVCDNEMMRRLSLSVKHIMRTKGTTHGIEMMMGLFGFGKDIDYTLREEAYYTEKMIRSNECVDGTIDGKSNGDDWSSVIGVDWKTIDNHEKGSLAYEINANKELNRLYNQDPLSGIPMANMILGRDYVDGNGILHFAHSYLVPYYNQAQLYDGDLIFQGKGGWGKMLTSNDNEIGEFNYNETLSYLHVVGTIGDMLSLNGNSLDNNAIYYVVNLDEYTKHNERPPIGEDITLSHFFTLINSNETSKFSSWKNIVIQPKLNYDNTFVSVTRSTFDRFVADGDWDFEKYNYAFAKMQYLDNIISVNIGNNPHVGYGKYDDGKEFIEYMKLPFKHLIDNKDNSPQNSSLGIVAEMYNFDDIGNDVVTDKIQIMNSRNSDNYEDGKTDYVKYIKGTSDKPYENRTGYILAEENDDSRRIDGYEAVDVSDSIPNYGSEYQPAEINDLPDTSDELTKIYVHEENEYNVEKRWYINTKVLTITNKMNLDDNGLFSRYFKSVIMPYLTQVIPSTTILKLENFE